MPDTTINSFVVRFVQDIDKKPATPPWHGVIRHIQSNSEVRFASIDEALAFMDGYVDLAQPGVKGEVSNP